MRTVIATALLVWAFVCWLALGLCLLLLWQAVWRLLS